MDRESLRLGIDVGSTTVKVVVMDPLTKKARFSRYRRHNAYQSETARELLAEVQEQFPHATFRAAICGSGGKPIADAIGAHFVQEVVANAVAVRAFYPHARVAIELGGQDAKIVFFYHDEVSGQLVASDMRMNGSCAGGTGAFIDEVAALLRTPVEEFETLAVKGTAVYDISGRCGVFAKTDIQPLLNQGGLREDIALSTFHAIAKQSIGGLAQGLELKPPIIFEGGPLTFNPTLIRVFAERLGLSENDIIRPENPETLIAHGAALSIEEIFKEGSTENTRGFSLKDALATLSTFHEHIRDKAPSRGAVYFATAQERADFDKRHQLAPPPHHTARRGDTLRVYLGIDAGSTTSKFVLLDENEVVVDRFYASNKGEPLKVIKQALLDMKKRYDDDGVTLDIIALGTTGYGELLFDKAFGADYHTVETVAHAEAARKYAPGASFILDIGGQDMKAISITNGIVTNITVNEACSSGCGSFLENFAANLNIPLESIATAAFDAQHPAELGSRCTVFMNSTIITEQKNGKQADDIMAGLCRSIVENVFTKVVRLSNFSALGDKVVVQGGTFKNDAVLRALEQYIGKEVVRAPYPGEMGAIGIALLTKKHLAEKLGNKQRQQNARSRFIGFDVLQTFTYTQESNVTCTFCANNCNRTLVTFSNGKTWITGNRCERGELLGDSKDANLREKLRKISADMDAVPDMIKTREKLLFKDYEFTLLDKPRDIVIGLPRVLDFWRTMPFFTTFFHALGFKTKISRPSSKKLFETGLPFVASDTVCFPAKLAHGHLHDLLDSGGKVDRVFMPLFNHLPSENLEPQSTFTCPVLKGYPLVVKYSDDPERRWHTPFDTPIFHWFKQQDRDYQLSRYIKNTFGIDEETCLKAIAQGDEALAAFNAELLAECKRIIAGVEKKRQIDPTAFAVVLAGRHYQFDQLVNHQLSRYFTSLGIPVLTVDALPGMQEVDLSKTRIDITNSNHARLLSGAILAAEHPALEYVEIFSFGCGHDALFTDEVTRLLYEIAGKSPLILKLDESDVAGPLRIRVRSFIETVQARRQKDMGRVVTKPLGDPYEVKFAKEDRNLKTILIPNVSRTYCKVMSATLRSEGLKVDPLPMGGREAMRLGKKYVHNDSCFPAQIIIGEALEALQSGRYDPDQVVVGTGKTMCDCRLTNYMMLTRKALDDAGYANVPILSSDFTDTKNLHPAFRFNKLTYARAAWGIIMTDVLEDLRRKIRPYELNKGETDRVFEAAVDEICEALSMRGLSVRGLSMSAGYMAYKKALDAICAIPYDRTIRKPVVFITGEYLMTFHSGSNFNIEEYLEKNGMEVELPRMYDVYRNLMLFHTVSEVLDFNVHHSLPDMLYAFGGERYSDLAIDLVEYAARKHPLFEPSLRLPQMAKLSDHIIHHSIQSGEGFLMVADILHRAAAGVKSFVIIQPFGCLPNHVCGRGVIKRIKEEFPAIQILPLDYDPDTSFANIENRLQMLIMNAKNFDNSDGDHVDTSGHGINTMLSKLPIYEFLRRKIAAVS
ncbi:MAG: acyl-CoA dehydratase activase [Treponema sp.]|jgi:predicted CoA-substrate-specific enzyme activase|nr:acyl-CoA dehydratase activase [Treponema sp.]